MRLRVPTPEEAMGILGTGMILLLLTLAGIGVFGVFKAVTTTAKVDYCWIAANAQHGDPIQFWVHEHRPFASDAYLGPFENVDQALDASAKVKCPEVSVEP